MEEELDGNPRAMDGGVEVDDRPPGNSAGCSGIQRVFYANTVHLSVAQAACLDCSHNILCCDSAVASQWAGWQPIPRSVNREINGVALAAQPKNVGLPRYVISHAKQLRASHCPATVSLHVQIIHQAGVVHNDTVAFAGVFAEELAECLVGF
jgi:hypothetical protein